MATQVTAAEIADRWKDDGPRKLFDVTCTIGSVYEGQDANARDLAFLMISQHDAEGTYRFPREDGGEYVITIEHALPKEV